MKSGRSLQDLAAELDRRRGTKQDFVADTRQISVAMQENRPAIQLAGQDDRFNLTNHAINQMGTWAGVPAKYIERMIAEAPDLLPVNLNHWLNSPPAPKERPRKAGSRRRRVLTRDNDPSVKRMVRTLDGEARAFLSNRYRRIDNEDVMEMALPVLMEDRNLNIVSCEVTDRKLYIKALYPELEGRAVGDVVQAGIVISNSEIGLGSIQVSPLLMILRCENGMILPDDSLRRYHIGRAVGGGEYEGAVEVFADDTNEAADKTLILQLRDTVRASREQAMLGKGIELLEAAASGTKIERPVEAVEVLAKQIGLNQKEKTSVLTELIRFGDMSRYGVMNAVTQAAGEADDYDRATELERAGASVLKINPTEWKEVIDAEPIAV